MKKEDCPKAWGDPGEEEAESTEPLQFDCSQAPTQWVKGEPPEGSTKSAAEAEPGKDTGPGELTKMAAIQKEFCGDECIEEFTKLVLDTLKDRCFDELTPALVNFMVQMMEKGGMRRQLSGTPQLEEEELGNLLGLLMGGGAGGETTKETG